MNSIFLVFIVLFIVQIWFLILNSILQIRVKNIAESTHNIVNSKHDALLRLVSELCRRIANDNPSDAKAQEAANIAEQEARETGKQRRVMI